MKPIDVNILKPLYGNYVYVRDKYINTAIKLGVMLKITIPQGTALVDPKEWKKNGKKMSKVFKDPKHPMILYGGNVPIQGIPKGTITKKELPVTKPLW